VPSTGKTSRLARPAIALLAAAAAVLTMAPVGRPSTAPPIDAYRGLGAWVDIFDGRYWDNPEALVADLESRGVRTLYLQTCNAGCDVPIHRPSKVADFINASHEAGIKVVAWYLPEFVDMEKDRARTRAAVRFETGLGQRFDSFALDIESLTIASDAVRNRRTLRLSRWLRDLVGPDYPLGAIVPPFFYSWQNFPYRELAPIYDVFLPMNYFTVRTDGPKGARAHTQANIRTIRRGTGIPNVPIHSIGGLAADTGPQELLAMARVAREHGLLGTSLYDADTSQPWQWSALRSFPVNPRQTPALPVRPRNQPNALGNLPGEDRTHPESVWFRLGKGRRPRTLQLQAAGIDPGEVALLVNWRKIQDLAPSSGWSETRTIRLRAGLFRRKGPNLIGFVADGEFPTWREWGVRRVEVTS
jgi:hypothetical protein